MTSTWFQLLIHCAYFFVWIFFFLSRVVVVVVPLIGEMVALATVEWLDTDRERVLRTLLDVVGWLVVLIVLFKVGTRVGTALKQTSFVLKNNVDSFVLKWTDFSDWFTLIFCSQIVYLFIAALIHIQMTKTGHGSRRWSVDRVMMEWTAIEV